MTYRISASRYVARKLYELDVADRLTAAQGVARMAAAAGEALVILPGADCPHLMEVSRDIDNAARLADEVVEWCSQISMFPREFCVPEPELVELALFAPLRPGVVPGFVAQNRVVAQRLERHLGTLDNLERTWTQVALLFPAVDALDELAAFIEWPLLRDLSRELRTVLDMQEFLLAWSEWSEGRVLV